LQVFDQDFGATGFVIPTDDAGVVVIALTRNNAFLKVQFQFHDLCSPLIVV
jgi:hypothetical protein